MDNFATLRTMFDEPSASEVS